MKKKVFNFTHNELMKIKPPEKGRDKYKDAKDERLVLIVSYGGSKVFYYGKKIDGKYKLIWIGHFPEVSIVDAQKKAIEFKAQIANGINPMEKPSPLPEEVDTELTFKELFDRYINDYAQYKIARYKDVIADIKRQASHLFARKISSIQREDMQKIFNNLTKEGKFRTANIAVQRFKIIFNKAIEWELLEKNPATGIETHKEKQRTRYINAEEKGHFFEAVKQVKNQQIADLFLISLFTGARKSNVLEMKWESISYEDKTWFIEKTKNGQPQLIHLVEPVFVVEPVFEVLKRRRENNNSIWVFPSHKSRSGHIASPKGVWKKICIKAKLNNARIHDLRRTHATWMGKAGANNEIIGKALNHQSLTTTQRYNIIESDQVKEFREKAIRNLFGTRENKEISFTNMSSVKSNAEAIKKQIKELELELNALENSPA